MARYRIEPPEGQTVVVLNSSVMRAGAEVDHLGWPPEGLAPLDDEAKKISDYASKHAFNPRRPLRPTDPSTNQFYLPGCYPQFGGGPPSAALVDDAAARVEMPRYVMHHDLCLTHRRPVPGGTPFYFIGWPDDWMHPENSAAREVVDYYGQHKGHAQLRPSPWCVMREGLFLPDLPAPPKSRASRAEPTVSDVRMTSRANASQLPPPRYFRGAPRRVPS